RSRVPRSWFLSSTDFLPADRMREPPSAYRRSISRVLSGRDLLRSGRSFLSGCGRPHPPAAYPRRVDRGGPPLAAYLALLQLGFTVPPTLPWARWALTRPQPFGCHRFTLA